MICKTVGELREALSKFDDNLPLACDGPDIGGYDVCYCPDVSLKVRKKWNLYIYNREQHKGENKVFDFPALVISGCLRENNTKYGDDFMNLLKKYFGVNK